MITCYHVSSILERLLLRIVQSFEFLTSLKSIVFNSGGKLFENLQSDLKIVVKCFSNQAISNPEQKALSCCKDTMSFKKQVIKILYYKSTKSIKLLRFKIYQYSIFERNISALCKRTIEGSKKILSQITNSLDEQESKLLYRLFVLLQFDFLSIV